MAESVPTVAIGPLGTVVEVTSDAPLELQTRLLAIAYRASQWGPVTLLLRGVPRQLLDRMLDPVVKSVGVDVWGVEYCELQDDGIPPQVLENAALGIVATEPLRERLLERGLRVIRVEEAVQAFARAADSNISQVEVELRASAGAPVSSSPLVNQSAGECGEMAEGIASVSVRSHNSRGSTPSEMARPTRRPIMKLLSTQ